MNTIVSRTLSVHKEHELLLKLENAGLTDKLAQRVIDSKDNDLAIKLVLLIEHDQIQTSQILARKIMGENYFGIGEAMDYFGVNPTKQQLAYLAEVPFSKETLVACKDTHVLVAIFSLSIIDIRSIVDKSEQNLLYNRDWYDKQVFAQDKGDVGWQLVRKTPVEKSTSKEWNEQRTLLSTNEEVPNTRVLVYTVIGHFLVTGERLFEHIYVRCADIDSFGPAGMRVIVGDFRDDVLQIARQHRDRVDDYMGISSAKKHERPW